MSFKTQFTEHKSQYGQLHLQLSAEFLLQWNSYENVHISLYS